MSSSLWIGTTGLTASEKQMDVIGNNLANANTVGFKAADTYFASMLSQNLSGGGGGQRVGQGVGVAAVSTIFGQGTFESTGNATDLAIDGNGFFVIRDKDNNYLYTRAGAFHLNKDGILSDLNDYSVVGHSFIDGIEGDERSSLNLSDAQSKPTSTTFFGIGLILNSQTETGGVFSTSQVVYDMGGATYNLNTKFTKMADSDYWGTETSLVNAKDATKTYKGVQSYSVIKFDSNGAMTGVYKPALSTPGVTGTTTVTKSEIINPVNLNKAVTTSPQISLKYSTATTSWSLTNSTDYPNLTITSPDTTHLGIDLDGTGGADIMFTLGGSLSNNDTITFDISRTGGPLQNITADFTSGEISGLTTTIPSATVSYTVNSPNRLDTATALPITMTWDNAASKWTVGASADYPSMIVSTDSASSGKVVNIDLDGGGVSDIKFTSTAAPANGNTITFNITPSYPNVGTDGSGILTWNLKGLTNHEAPPITSYATASGISALDNDGYALGYLTSLEIDKGGIVEGMFSNGQRQKLARILLADFKNAQGLSKMGSYFIPTAESNTANINSPGTNGLGDLQSHSLEVSNADVAKEFIKMITAQRAYQASARIITTADQMLQELMNIKR